MTTHDNSSLHNDSDNDSCSAICSEGPTKYANISPSVLSILAPSTDECLHVEIPIALCKYDNSGFYITFLMRFVDTRNRWRWQCARRYSEFRAFHRQVGRHMLPSIFNLSKESVSFPPVILLARSNREKNLIENRRQRLELYMQKVLQESADLARNFGSRKGFFGMHLTSEKTSMERFGKLLAFIEHPNTSDEILLHAHQHNDNRELLSVPSNAWECSSVASENILSIQEDASKHSITSMGIIAVKPPPPIISTYWAPPPALPGPRLGLCLPSACVTQNLRGEWHTIVTSSRGDRRVNLRYIHDQVVALSGAMAIAEDGIVFSVPECKEFLVNFRVEHPISAYVRLAEELEEISQLSRRGTSPDGRVPNTKAAVSPDRRNSKNRSSNNRIQECIPIPSPPAEDLAYEPQPQSSRVLHVRSSPSVASLQSQWERQALSASRGLYSSNSCSRMESRRDEACQHFTLRADWETVPFPYRGGEDAQALQASDEGETVPWKFLNVFDKSNGVENSFASYIDNMRDSPVEYCFCTDRNFCTSGKGDLYRTKCGFTIIVCPP